MSILGITFAKLSEVNVTLLIIHCGIFVCGIRIMAVTDEYFN